MNRRQFFKRAAGFPNYSVTKDGKVWSKPRMHTKGGWLSPRTDAKGYQVVDLWSGSEHKFYKVHRLVLEAFIGPCPEGMQCRHLNGNPADNRLGNLQWGTQSENVQDAIKHGTHSNGRLGQYGEKHPQSKLSDANRCLLFSVYHDGSYTQQELADYFSVSQMGVSRIVNTTCWNSCA